MGRQPQHSLEGYVNYIILKHNGNDIVEHTIEPIFESNQRIYIWRHVNTFQIGLVVSVPLWGRTNTIPFLYLSI